MSATAKLENYWFFSKVILLKNDTEGLLKGALWEVKLWPLLSDLDL